jgi:hypothetical protein
MNPNATLLQAMYVLTKKTFLISAPSIEFCITPHLYPHAMPYIRLREAVSEI